MLDGLGSEPAQGEGHALSGTEATVVCTVLVIAQAKVGYFNPQSMTDLSMSVCM